MEKRAEAPENTIRDKTVYAYQEVGSGSLPFLFVHGWACDHSFFSPQIDYFSRYHRVIAPDGSAQPAPLRLSVGTRYRFRLINITPKDMDLEVSLTSNSFNPCKRVRRTPPPGSVLDQHLLPNQVLDVAQ